MDYLGERRRCACLVLEEKCFANLGMLHENVEYYNMELEYHSDLAMKCCNDMHEMLNSLVQVDKCLLKNAKCQMMLAQKLWEDAFGAAIACPTCIYH